VRKKVQKGNLPRELKEKVAESAANLAVSLIAQEDFARMMSSKLCKILPIIMERKGLTATVEEVFREGLFFVLESRILQVDLVKAEEAIREEEADLTMDDDAQSFTSLLLNWSLRMIGPGNKKKLEEYLFPRVVHETVQNEMSSIMEENFVERRLRADLEILGESDQALYFFSHLKTMKEATKKKKGRNPLEEWRKRIEEDLDSADSDDSLMAI
jgi:hypothetical protein